MGEQRSLFCDNNTSKAICQTEAGFYKSSNLSMKKKNSYLALTKVAIPKNLIDYDKSKMSFKDMQNTEPIEYLEKTDFIDVSEILKNSKKEYKVINPIIRKIKLIICFILLGLAIPTALYSAYMIFFPVQDRMQRSTDTTEYTNILTADEISKWELVPTEKSSGYVDMNTSISIIKDTRAANVRIINPPYSTFASQVVITMADDPDNPYYESDMIYPGTVIDVVTFNRDLPYKVPDDSQPNHETTYKGFAYYTFYDADENIITDYKLEVNLVLQGEGQETPFVYGLNDITE